MKKLLLLCILVGTLPLASYAKKGGPESEGLYIVPSQPDLVTHSRFMVQVVKPFEGAQTQSISYIFPEILIGEKDRLIEFTRIDSTKNSWTSDLLTAHCMVLDDIFSCNISVKKDEQQSRLDLISQWLFPRAQAFAGRLCRGQAIAHLDNMELSAVDIKQFKQVIGSFCFSEPAGFLSYEFR